ncbi:MAG: N-acetylmuramoyl-L-alanine amidase [Hydrogenoanaerobacterium sp.]
MPYIYLSPSTQEGNMYVIGGSEEQYMNLLADAMVPYLRSSGIQYIRNTPEMTAASSVRESNEDNYDFHLALHSNASPDDRYGLRQGPEVYYYPGSSEGLRMSEIIAHNLQDIYPQPSLVRILPTTRLGEVRLTKAPGVLVEFAYHDNIPDAMWIQNNIDKIAQSVVLSLTEYFGIPFVEAQPPRSGTVSLESGRLNIRQYPNTGSPILSTAKNGDTITVLGRWQGWDIVRYKGTVGYADGKYII